MLHSHVYITLLTCVYNFNGIFFKQFNLLSFVPQLTIIVQLVYGKFEYFERTLRVKASGFVQRIVHSLNTVIRFVWVSAKFGTCIVMSVNGALIEVKVRRFKGECAHFSLKKCPIYTHDGASAKFSPNSHETDYSEGSVQQDGSGWN